MGAWRSEVDFQLKMKAEGEVGRIRRWLEDKKPQEEIITRKDQIKFEIESHEGRIRLQADLMQDNMGKVSPKQRQMRPPKNEIETLQGLFMNWPQSRRQFTETTDNSNIAPIDKFAHLYGLERCKCWRIFLCRLLERTTNERGPYYKAYMQKNRQL